MAKRKKSKEPEPIPEPVEMAMGDSFVTFLKVQFARCLRKKKIIVLGLILLLPVALAVYNVTRGEKIPWEAITGFVGTIYLPFLLPIVALFYAGPVIVEDIEQRTYLYLIPRPLARYQQFLAKIAASASTTLVLVGASLVIFVGILLPLLWGQANAGESILKLVIALLLGTLAYTGLFAALASIFGRSILAGILYFILFEGMLSRLPVLELLSIRFHLYKLLEYVPEEAATDMFLPRALEVTPTMSGVSLGVAAAVFIGVGLLVSEYKEYK